VHAKRNTAVSAILMVMLALAGCGGSGSSNPDSVSNTDDRATEEMVMKLYKVLSGDFGIADIPRTGDINTTLSSDFDEFNLDNSRYGRAVLTRTTDSVLPNNGWTGAHFRNGEKEARVYYRAETNENAYFYYGWWIDSNNNNGGYTVVLVSDSTAVANASAAEDVSAATDAATYEGGAAGQYAIYSTVSKANESGHFTADVTLKANFDTDRVSGTIDGFTVDGKGKDDWSVELSESGPANDRAFAGTAVWEIDGNQPSDVDRANSDWVAGFRDIGADGIPDIAGGYVQVLNGNASMVASFGTTKSSD